MFVFICALMIGDGVQFKIPDLEDHNLERRLRNNEAFGYTEQTMPPCYQDWEGALQGIFNIHHNVSGDRSEPFGNGNKEFPWAKPAGTDTTATSAVRFLLLPRKEDGSRWPVVMFRQQPYSIGPTNVQKSLGFAWTYPIGAVVGEVLYLPSPKGEAKPYEVRTRTRTKDSWSPEVYRPYRTSQELYDAVEIKKPGWRFDPKLKEFMDKFKNGGTISGPYRMADFNHDRTSVDRTAFIDKLPPLQDDLVDALLNVQFKKSAGWHWRDGDGAPTVPTTDAPYHVVPTNYFAGHVVVDSKSCMDCHRTTNKHVNEFQMRDWYGRIRGSDGIFSLHPFDPSCIDSSGFGAQDKPPKMNRGLVANGIFAIFDSNIHKMDRYRKIEGLD